MKKDPHHKRESQKYANPIPSREFILGLMADLGVPLGFKQLVSELGLADEADQDALRNRLRAMVRDGQVVVDRRNVYAIASKMELVAGKVLAHADGFGFLSVTDQDEDVFLSNRQMRAVFHGDIAQVRIRGKDRRGRIEGEIVEVIERNTDQVVGRLYYEGKVTLLESLNNRIIQKILIPDVDRKLHKAGQIVVAGIIEQPSMHGIPTAEILETLGDHLTPAMEVEVALRSHDIPFTFTDEVHSQTDAMPIEVAARDKKNRRDLTDLPFITIDGEDARDFDDAVYCEARQSGGWRLFVAIADVAHYVDIDSPLDKAAFDRGTSVYFPQYVVPMLPEKLSNGLCSLKPDVDRLVLVAEMTISENGRISGFQFYEGIIHSHARMTYVQVANILKGEREDHGKQPAVRAGISELNNVYQVLTKVREKRGALDFGSRELAFDFSDEGRVLAIRPTGRTDAHRLIEECMLCANVCAARFIDKHQHAGLYRVHEPPEAEKLEGLSEYLANLGVNLSVAEKVTTLDYQIVLDQLRDRKHGQVLQMSLLRSLNQAVYQVENKGHFGLNYPEYAHFTSPIRRFPDLMMHRLIKSIVHSKTESNLVARFGAKDRRNFYPYTIDDVVMCGERSSFTERRAEAAVYDVLDWMKCDYISDHVDEVVPGVITGVTKFGLFVELDDIYIEGLVHISTLPNDYFHYDQSTQALIGERSGLAYALADEVSVQIVRVDIDERKVDFEVITHTPGFRSAPGKKRSGKKKSTGGGRGKERTRQSGGGGRSGKPRGRKR